MDDADNAKDCQLPYPSLHKLRPKLEGANDLQPCEEHSVEEADAGFQNSLFLRPKQETPRPPSRKKFYLFPSDEPKVRDPFVPHPDGPLADHG